MYDIKVVLWWEAYSILVSAPVPLGLIDKPESKSQVQAQSQI